MKVSDHTTPIIEEIERLYGATLISDCIDLCRAHVTSFTGEQRTKIFEYIGKCSVMIDESMEQSEQSYTNAKDENRELYSRILSAEIAYQILPSPRREEMKELRKKLVVEFKTAFVAQIKQLTEKGDYEKSLRYTLDGKKYIPEDPCFEALAYYVEVHQALTNKNINGVEDLFAKVKFMEKVTKQDAEFRGLYHNIKSRIPKHNELSIEERLIQLRNKMQNSDGVEKTRAQFERDALIPVYKTHVLDQLKELYADLDSISFADITENAYNPRRTPANEERVKRALEIAKRAREITTPSKFEHSFNAMIAYAETRYKNFVGYKGKMNMEEVDVFVSKCTEDQCVLDEMVKFLLHVTAIAVTRRFLEEFVNKEYDKAREEFNSDIFQHKDFQHFKEDCVDWWGNSLSNNLFRPAFESKNVPEMKRLLDPEFIGLSEKWYNMMAPMLKTYDVSCDTAELIAINVMDKCKKDIRTDAKKYTFEQANFKTLQNFLKDSIFDGKNFKFLNIFSGYIDQEIGQDLVDRLCKIVIGCFTYKTKGKIRANIKINPAGVTTESIHTVVGKFEQEFNEALQAANEQAVSYQQTSMPRGANGAGRQANNAPLPTNMPQVVGGPLHGNSSSPGDTSSSVSSSNSASAESPPKSGYRQAPPPYETVFARHP